MDGNFGLSFPCFVEPSSVEALMRKGAPNKHLEVGVCRRLVLHPSPKQPTHICGRRRPIWRCVYRVKSFRYVILQTKTQLARCPMKTTYTVLSMGGSPFGSQLAGRYSASLMQFHSEPPKAVYKVRRSLPTTWNGLQCTKIITNNLELGMSQDDCWRAWEILTSTCGQYRSLAHSS